MPQQERLPMIKPKKVRTRSNKKVLMLLIVFFIILFMVLFINSSFSRISEIQIQGHYYLTKEEIEQASQLNMDDHFFAVTAKTIEERVNSLEIVAETQVSKAFPGSITIEVTEYPTVAYQIALNGTIEAILASGIVVPIEHDAEHMMDKPILTGWSSQDPVKQQLSEALAEIPSVQLIDVSEIKPDPSQSYPDRIRLYTRSQFEVVTSVSFLLEKLGYLEHIVSDLYDSGITTGEITMLHADSHRPFEEGIGNGEAMEIND